MSLENEEEGTLSEIWAEVEGLVGEGDFEGAESVIARAKADGWVVVEMEAYLKAQQEK